MADPAHPTTSAAPAPPPPDVLPYTPFPRPLRRLRRGPIFMPELPSVLLASSEVVGFAKTELASRKQVGLPPFARMVRIVLRDQEADKLHKYSEELAAQLEEAAVKEGGVIRMKGPMPCAISRIAGYFRNQIVMLAPTAAPLQRVLAGVREKGHLAKNERIAVDVDPVSLL